MQKELLSENRKVWLTRSEACFIFPLTAFNYFVSVLSVRALTLTRQRHAVKEEKIQKKKKGKKTSCRG